MNQGLLNWLFLLSVVGIADQAQALAGDDVLPFGLMVSHNRGFDNMERLRYAHRDAEKVRDVFVELGGLEPERVIMLQGGDAADVRSAMQKIEAQIASAKRAGHAVLLVFYYSGHAKDGELFLGNSRLSMRELKDWFNNSSADIRVAFVDACQSGEFTRMKGGSYAPSIVEVDKTKGQIIITSSAANEGSQESDEIGGSYFTHYLTSGLRGDADQTADGRVSLREIYDYSYHRTVHRTASSRGGIQHPTYGYQLAGQGEIPLTQIQRLESGLVFPKGLQGTYLVYDITKQCLVAELQKKATEKRTIAIKPGNYTVKKRRPADLLVKDVRIDPSQKTVIQDKDLSAIAFEDDTTKGLIRIEGRSWDIDYSLRIGVETFFDTPTRENLFYDAGQIGFQVELIDFISRNLSWAFDLLFGAGNDSTRLDLDDGQSQQVSTQFFRFQIGTGLYYRIDWPWFGLYAGPRLTFLYATRSLGEPFNNYPQQTFGTLSPGFALGARLHWGRWHLFGEGRVNYLYYNLTQEDVSMGFGGLYLGVSYRH